MHEQDSKRGSLSLPQVSKSFPTKSQALSRASSFVPQSFFEWEMSPLSPKPKVFYRRLSDLNDRNLVDAFESFYPVDFQDQNPFEPTPLSSSSGLIQPPCIWPRLHGKWEENRNPSFEPQPLLDRFQPLRTSNEVPLFEDIFAPSLDASDCVFQRGDTNGLDFAPFVTAAFAA